ncbi:MAG: ABC transporter ATP-binding protein [Kiritimatiellia bacterium]|nr:ABC transporter ATP-binding protein [Kiritimatiellia bacterium]
MTGSAPQNREDPVIDLDGISRRYRMGAADVFALREMSLRIPKGGFWAVMGPSGSGKSTLLNLLGCLDRPTTGRYLLEGADVAQLDDDALSERRLRRLGFIFQSFHLLPQLSVLENIELPLYYLGCEAEESRSRARRLAERVGLEGRTDHRPSELSGGQCQRVAIARALVNDPAVILADEPTGNLDTQTGDQIMSLLQELNREGRTLVMVTHEPDIAAVAQNRLYLRDGRIERIDGEGPA